MLKPNINFDASTDDNFNDSINVTTAQILTAKRELYKL